MPVGWKITSITFHENPRGSSKNVPFGDDKGPVICVHEDDTRILIKREGEGGFIKQYHIDNIFEINWEEPIV
jgi:hypothetical protein